jgi:hypothetical protein
MHNKYFSEAIVTAKKKPLPDLNVVAIAIGSG